MSRPNRQQDAGRLVNPQAAPDRCSDAIDPVDILETRQAAAPTLPAHHKRSN
ncbi:hypothetical protein ACT8ZS_09125 [Paenibacillus sp. M.A.Huq-84]